MNRFCTFYQIEMHIYILKINLEEIRILECCNESSIIEKEKKKTVLITVFINLIKLKKYNCSP